MVLPPPSHQRLPAPLRFLVPKPWRERGPVVPVLRFGGPIGLVTPLRPGLTLATLAPVIERAFSMRHALAVALQVNSPGGSPVQSMLIFHRIRALAREKNLPVYVFAEDVAASGGYILALAGDEIYADASSLVGSIGVVSASFGFDRMIDKIGVDRRVYTAGEHKMALDPFQPEKEDEVRHLKSIQEDVHQVFIALVKERRGDRLRGAPEELFSGRFWSGKQALALGLIDGLADVRGKMRETFGEDIRLKLVAPERSLFRRRVRGVFGPTEHAALHAGFPAPSFAEELVSAIEARALWSRFGF